MRDLWLPRSRSPDLADRTGTSFVCSPPLALLVVPAVAEALGLAGVTGAIRPGLAADLVAVEGDPIADADGPGGHAGRASLGGLRRVRDVIQGGRAPPMDQFCDRARACTRRGR